MKLSDYIKDLGRTIAFYPGLTPRVTHSTNATILLCQFLYWCDKTKDNGGWIYKDSCVYSSASVANNNYGTD